MFTSRAEYRLRLRADNADARLTPLGDALGCVGGERSAAFTAKSAAMQEGRALLGGLSATPDEAIAKGMAVNRDGRRRTGFELLAFPDMSVGRLRALWPELARLAPGIAAQLEIDARYDNYLRRQDAGIEAYRKDEAIAIPPGIDYRAMAGLSTELRQKLEQGRPASLAQAARIDGMTPAALMLVLANVKKAPRRRSA